MLIDFSVTNYRSIKDKQTFSMQPIKRIDELPEHIINNGKHSALSSAIIYGRNASGKSNLLKAMDSIKHFINYSANSKGMGNELWGIEPFLLDLDSPDSPIEFSVTYIASDSIKYSYELSLLKKKIVHEILYYYPNGRQTLLFSRNSSNEITSDLPQRTIRSIQERMYDNQAFLSKVGYEKIEKLLPAFTFWSNENLSYFFHDANFEEDLRNILLEKIIANNNYKTLEYLSQIIKIVDTGIDEIKIIKYDETDFLNTNVPAETLKAFLEQFQYSPKTIHKVYKEGKVVGEKIFDMNEESDGTNKLLTLGLLMLNILEEGGVIMVDELEKNLHPLLTKTLINLFHNPKTNPNGAQLIFATHDVSLLDNELFRRDQIWFSEKGNDGASTYYSLADLKGIRAGVPLEKYYLKGAFGATPIINEHDLVFNFGEKNEQK